MPSSFDAVLITSTKVVVFTLSVALLGWLISVITDIQNVTGDFVQQCNMQEFLVLLYIVPFVFVGVYLTFYFIPVMRLLGRC